MKCPKCRLINPDTALRCDCGYDFPSGQMKESYLDRGATERPNQHTVNLLTSAFSMEGRLNRGRFLLLISLVYLGWFSLLALIFAIANEQTASSLGLASFFVLIPMHALQIVKRLHDLGRPGTHYWLGFIPVYNVYFILVLWFKRGTTGPNKYGPDLLAASIRR
jgi:uncharacterized membrane protein YhaH (DUF805 family)